LSRKQDKTPLQCREEGKIRQGRGEEEKARWVLHGLKYYMDTSIY
jgi:hypothetical protein